MKDYKVIFEASSNKKYKGQFKEAVDPKTEELLPVIITKYLVRSGIPLAKASFLTGKLILLINAYVSMKGSMKVPVLIDKILGVLKVEPDEYSGK